MKDFLKKVKNACKSIGESPYDDEKTRKAESEETRKTVELCKQLKKEKSSP